MKMDEQQKQESRGSLPPGRFWQALDDLRDQHALLRKRVTALNTDILTTITNLEALRDGTLKLFESREGYILHRLALIEGAIIEIGRNTGLFTTDMEETLRKEQESEVAIPRDQGEEDALMQGAGEVIGGALINSLEEEDDAPPPQA